jgi:hypothetical protein
MRWAAGIAALLVAVVVGFQLQHLAWSTARVQNDSALTLLDVRLRVDDATVVIGELAPGQARFVRLPDRGDASLSVEFVSPGRRHAGCREYVEGDMYHVRITVSAALDVACRTELGLLTRRLMLLELW